MLELSKIQQIYFELDILPLSVLQVLMSDTCIRHGHII